MAIPQSVVDEIIEKNDIGEVIGEYVKLTRKGSTGYMGNCPFHNEKTPSFSVHTGKQIFKCFGCGKGGNVVHFISLIENLSYYDSLCFLAERVGIKIEKDNKEKNNPDAKLISDILSVNRIAAKFFFDNLKKSKVAQQYLKKRGLSVEFVKSFGLGYAPDSWDSLTNYLKAPPYSVSDDLLDKAGLGVKRESGGYYDKFRNRVMFPIFDANGNVIAFGGRVMDDSHPKYLNSPQTPAYIKGNHVYGLNFAKKSEQRSVIVVEGYMDCIALHKMGITNAVATLGTAVTPGQAKILKKYFDRVYVGYDADSAGQAAILRGIDIFRAAGLSVKTLSLAVIDPDVKDPDDFFKKHTADDFKKVIDKAKTDIEYKVETAASKHKLDELAGKSDFIKEVIPILAVISNAAELQMYAKWVSEHYVIPFEPLMSEINRIIAKGGVVDVNSVFGRKVLKKGAAGRAKEDDNMESSREINPEMLKLDRLEKMLILLLSEDAGVFAQYEASVAGYLTIDENNKLFQKLANRYKAGSRTGIEYVMADVEDGDTLIISELVSKWLTPPDINQAAYDIYMQCMKLRCDIKISSINEILGRNDLDDDKKVEYLTKLKAIIEERKRYLK